jgi:hypothetical protein
MNLYFVILTAICYVIYFVNPLNIIDTKLENKIYKASNLTNNSTDGQIYCYAKKVFNQLVNSLYFITSL